MSNYLIMPMLIKRSILIIVFFLIFFPSPVFAKTVKLTPHLDTWTLYTFGNGDIIASVLFGLQSLVKSKVFINLINLMVLMGFGGLVLSHISEGRWLLTSTVKYLLFTAILLRILFGLTLSVGLIDSLNPEYDQVLSEVPFLVGAPACFLSTLGQIFASKLDEAYSRYSGLPLSLTMTGGSAKGATGAPFNILAHMLMDGAEYTIQDPFLKNSLTYFMVDCVIPLIDSGYLSTHQLLNSDNVWGLLDIHHINPAIMTVYYGYNAATSLGSVKTCRQAYDMLNRDLQIEKPDFVAKWGKDMTAGAAASLFQTVLNYTARQTHYAPTPAHYLQQAALLRILQGPALNLMGMQTNSSFLMQQVSTQQAIQSAQTSWTTTAAVFQATFGYLYAALQVLVYAMAPMVAALMVLPGLRMLVMRRYLQLLAWFPVTLILLTVTNDMLVYWSQKALNQVWRNHGGFSLVGAPFISARAANMTAVGSWLITLVPMMAWGLVAGFNSAMGALLNTTGIQTLGANAAIQTVTGNIALDNQNYSNLSSNKFNTAMKTDMGAMPVNSYGSGTNIMQEDNLGGLSVLKNGLSDMHSKQNTRQIIRSSYALDTQGMMDRKSLNNATDISQFSTVSAESSDKLTEKLHAGIKGGAVAGAVSAYIQKALADKNYHALDTDTARQVGDDVQSAVFASMHADRAKGQGHSKSAEGFVEKSEALLEHAMHTLGQKLGGGPQAADVAVGLIHSAVKIGKGASFLKGIIPEGEGALNLDTEAAHGNRIDAAVSHRKSKQAWEQNLASSETRTGKQITITETATETFVSAHPGEDYYKAMNARPAAPVDSAVAKINQKQQEIQNKTGSVQGEVSDIKQKVDQAIHLNASATQPKEIFDFKSRHAAKAAYLVRPL